MNVKEIYKGMMLNRQLGIVENGGYKNWLVVKHTDGQWVTIYDLNKLMGAPNAQQEQAEICSNSPCNYCALFPCKASQQRKGYRCFSGRKLSTVR